MVALAICREIDDPTDYLHSIRSLEVGKITYVVSRCEEIPSVLNAFGREIRCPSKIAILREIILEIGRAHV